MNNQSFYSDTLAINIQDTFKYVLDNNLLDMQAILQMAEEAKKKQYLDNHPNSIWQGKNGYWYTYFPDDDKKRRLCKRRTKQALINEIIKFWHDKAENTIITFADVYKSWRAIEDQMVSCNTAAKYHSQYKRYFDDTDFAKMDIRSIDDDTIRIFMRTRIAELTLCKSACQRMYQSIDNTFLYAAKKKLIFHNPMQLLRCKDFYTYCTNHKKATEKQVFSDIELKILLNQLQEDHRLKPNYIPSYAVECAVFTGMRIGEIAALRWDDINFRDNYIYIHCSEKSSPDKKTFWIDDTKNGIERQFPLSQETRKLFLTVKQIAFQYGYLCEWVFADDHGRIHTPKISSCLKSKCRQVKIAPRGIYALRKTLNSQLKCNGVPTTIAAALLGHTVDVNNKYYTYDISDMMEKTNIISQVNAKIVTA